MGLDGKRIQKPARKLRKLLKQMPSAPGADDIHKFRTNARRLETVLESFPLDDTKNGRQLAKQVAKLRKRAGKVRDLDVLTDYVSGVPRDASEGECSVRLLEYLGAQRVRQVKKFHNLQQRYDSSLRRRLKAAEKRIENILPPKGNGRLNGEPVSATVAASALARLAELREPAQLGRSTLHPYRLKVKELRNLLQMAETADNQPFVGRLGEVKDAIGEWHDWEVLVAIALDALDHGRNCALLQELRKTAARKYENALRLAQALRHEDLHLTTRKSKGASHDRTPQPKEEVWLATASLAA